MTVVNQVRLEGPLNQFVVQWDVPGALDGTRLAPGLTVINNGIIAGQQDEDAVFRIQCPGSAGIFDADALGKSGCYGDRYVQWIKIDAAVPINPGFGIFVVDDTALDPSLGVPLQLQEVTLGQTFTGLSSFYFAEMFLVPQGCAIQIVGLGPAPAGTSHGVKMGIRSASTGREDANLQGAMCCEEGAGTSGGGTPTPTPSPSREYYTFSSTALSAPIGGQDFYFQFGALLDVATFGASGANSNVSNSILDFSEGAASISAEKLSVRAGSVTGLVMRLTGVVPPLDGVQPFVEVAVGGGAFVRTYTAAAQPMGPNNNLDFLVAPVAFPVNARIRAGYTTTSLTIVDYTMQAELEITTLG